MRADAPACSDHVLNALTSKVSTSHLYAVLSETVSVESMFCLISADCSSAACYTLPRSMVPVAASDMMNGALIADAE